MADKFRRAKVPRHIRIYHRQMQSEAWLSLSGSAVKVLLALASLENGDNNGEFFLSVRTGAKLTGLGKDAVNRALQELQEKGFIYCATPGGFSRKTPHATCWGLTWVAGPKGGEHRAPSHAYDKWRPEKKRGPENKDSAVPGIGTVGQNGTSYCPENADSQTTKMAEIGQTPTVPKMGTHTSNQLPQARVAAHRPAHPSLLGWWQPDYSLPVASLVHSAVLTGQLEQTITERKRAA